MNVDSAALSGQRPLKRNRLSIPVISNLARNKGWPYVISWGHRLSGLLLVLYGLFHVYTLNTIRRPEVYDAEMKFYGRGFFAFLEWALAVPVILHALNGARLILYELFSQRSDRVMINWIVALSALYVIFLAGLMLQGGQSVSPGFFWLYALTLAVIAGLIVGAKIWRVRHAWTWKLQRITAAFLFVMIPAHLILAHLNLPFSHEAAQVTARMQSGFVKLVDVLLLLALAYHAGYGLVSLARDYLSHRVLRRLAIGLIVVVMLGAAGVGFALTLFI